MQRSETLSALAPALKLAQAEIEGAVKNKKNPHLKSDYADLLAVWTAVKEPLQRHGFSIVQLPCSAPDGRVGVETMLLHESGEFITGNFVLGVRKPDDPQAGASAVTYARRHALAAVVGVCPVDDDGEAAMLRTAALPHDELQSFLNSKNLTLDTVKRVTGKSQLRSLADVEKPDEVLAELQERVAGAEKLGKLGLGRETLAKVCTTVGRQVQGLLDLTPEELDLAHRDLQNQ